MEEAAPANSEVLTPPKNDWMMGGQTKRQNPGWKGTGPKLVITPPTLSFESLKVKARNNSNKNFEPKLLYEST